MKLNFQSVKSSNTKEHENLSLDLLFGVTSFMLSSPFGLRSSTFSSPCSGPLYNTALRAYSTLKCGQFRLTSFAFSAPFCDLNLSISLPVLLGEALNLIIIPRPNLFMIEVHQSKFRFYSLRQSKVLEKTLEGGGGRFPLGI